MQRRYMMPCVALSEANPSVRRLENTVYYNNNYYLNPLLPVFREVARKEVPYGKLSRIELHHA